jgi:fucose permease
MSFLTICKTFNGIIIICAIMLIFAIISHEYFDNFIKSKKVFSIKSSHLLNDDDKIVFDTSKLSANKLESIMSNVTKNVYFIIGLTIAVIMINSNDKKIKPELKKDDKKNINDCNNSISPINKL